MIFKKNDLRQIATWIKSNLSWYLWIPIVVPKGTLYGPKEGLQYGSKGTKPRFDFTQVAICFKSLCLMMFFLHKKTTEPDEPEFFSTAVRKWAAQLFAADHVA